MTNESVNGNLVKIKHFAHDVGNKCYCIVKWQDIVLGLSVGAPKHELTGTRSQLDESHDE